MNFNGLSVMAILPQLWVCVTSFFHSSALAMAIGLFGGLGLFLYGMKLMGDGLQNAAGDKLKAIFEKITSNPVKGILTGTIVTAIIQSSSATTVMVVGFVNAQLMNLYQATAVIMGANIGTTITAQMVTLNIDKLVPLFVGIGALIVLFARGKKSREIGNIVLGFGLLFLGIGLMTSSMEPLKQSQLFINLLKALDGNVFLGILTGLAVTAVIQSSSATTSLLIALTTTGALNISMAIPVLFGCNIGTCVTALLSSIGTSKTAKKAAVIHLLFNVLGTLIFIPLFKPLVWVVTSAPFFGSGEVKRQIANAHTIFNVLNTIILFPFIKCLVELVNRLIPGDDKIENYGTQYIDDRLLETPVIAVGQTTKEIIRMADKAKENLETSMQAFEKTDNSLIENVYKNERLINLLEDEITTFLVKLSKTELSDHQKDIITSMFHVVNDIERIGDHAENVADLASEKMVKKLQFSKEALDELKGMFNITVQCLNESIGSFENNDVLRAKKVKILEENIDKLEKDLRDSHVKRLNDGLCTASIGTVYLDLISNLERIGDHSMNIAESVLKNED